MLLDEFAPVYQFNEVHRIAIRAPADRIFRALEEGTLADIPLTKFLLEIRSLPRLLSWHRGVTFTASQPFLKWATSAGFVVLAQEANREIVLGLIGQFWKILGGSFPGVINAEAFVTFNRPGYAKAAINFCLEGVHGVHGSNLRTETRICVSDPIARKKFAGYWRLISFGSAITRREWLRAVKHRAELIV